MARFVVVSGLPAAGKSTVAGATAEKTGLPIFDKDDFLEELFGTRTLIDPGERSRLSRLADEQFVERAMASDGAVLVSFWRPPSMVTDSGTPTGWLAGLGDVTEVYCRCSVVTALERFVARQRHPGHGDERRSIDELRRQFERLSALGPLGIGRLIEIDTESPLPGVAAAIDLG